jgi:site-specific DNA-methyltransferase (adenine-specific)
MKVEGLKDERHFDRFSFYNADNMVIMKQYPDKYFDLAIVDPPYSETFNTNACADNKGKKGKYNISTLNGHLPTAEYWSELKRISKNQIIWGANWYGLYFGVGGICWFKNNTGNYSPCEYAYQSINNHVHHFKWTLNGMIQEKMANKQDRIHPTEKPTELYEWILKEFAKPNQKILDTHLGSGSIALAIDKANKLDNMNLEFVGIELDTEYFNAAMDRFRNAHRQQALDF